MLFRSAKPKPPPAAKIIRLNNPYKKKVKPITVTAPDTAAATAATPNPTTVAPPAGLEATRTTPPPPIGTKQTTYVIIETPPHEHLENNGIRDAVAKRLIESLLAQLFAIDPYASIGVYPGEEERINKLDQFTNLRRGTPKSRYPNTAFKLGRYISGWYPYKNGDPSRGKIKLLHTTPLKEIMAAINPPPEDLEQDLLFETDSPPHLPHQPLRDPGRQMLYFGMALWNPNEY